MLDGRSPRPSARDLSGRPSRVRAHGARKLRRPVRAADPGPGGATRVRRRGRGVDRGGGRRRDGGRRVGRGRRSGDAGPVGAGHDHQRLVDDQDDDQPLRADARRPRRAGRQREGRALLARVRGQRQAGHRGPPRARPHVRCVGMGSASHVAGHLRLGRRDRQARRPGAVVGAGHRVGLPRAQPGPSGRRDRAPDQRGLARHVLQARGRRSPWAPTSTSGSTRPSFTASRT